jgi:methyl-accepting chemotaxis protein
MIIHCSDCGKGYRLDAARLTGKGIKFNCKSCDKENIMIRENNNQLSHYSSKTKPQTSLVPKAKSSSIETTANEPFKISARQKKKTHRFGLTLKVTGIMLLISIIPLLLLWISSYKRFGTQIHDETEALMSEVATGLSEEMNEWIDVNVRVIYAISKMPAIISMDPTRQRPLLKLVQESYPWMYAVLTVGPDGMNVARNDDKPLKDYHDRIYVKEALKGNQLSWQTLVSRTNKKPAIAFSTPIRRQGKIVGLIVVGVNFDSMPRRVGNWRKGQTGYAFLLDENYKVISHPFENYAREQEIFDKNPLIAAHESGNNGLIQFQNSEGIPSVGIVKKTKLGWYLAVQQQKKEAFEVLTKSNQNAVILLAATIFLVIFIAWFSGQAITRPIKNITMAADRISVGDFNVSLNTKMKNEIGDLASSIIRMKECIRLSLKRLQKRRIPHQHQRKQKKISLS